MKRLQWWHVPAWFDIGSVAVLATATVVLLWIRADAIPVIIVLGLLGLMLLVLRYSSRAVVDEKGVSFSGALLSATRIEWSDVAVIAWEHELRGRFDTVLCATNHPMPRLLSRHRGPKAMVAQLNKITAVAGEAVEVRRPAHLNRFELAKTSASQWWPTDPRSGVERWGPVKDLGPRRTTSSDGP